MQSAVIKEGLRLSYGTTTRLPRIAHEDIRYKEHVIPAGVSAIEATRRRVANSLSDSHFTDAVFRSHAPVHLPRPRVFPTREVARASSKGHETRQIPRLLWQRQSPVFGLEVRIACYGLQTQSLTVPVSLTPKCTSRSWLLSADSTGRCTRPLSMTLSASTTFS